jgi:hypothetical protein
MPFTPPTPDQFVTRFPEFDGQDDAITAALAEANRAVDDSWTEGDYQNAYMYFAAHLLALAENTGSGGAAISSESLGPISVSYKTSSSASALASTSYGAQYARLLRLNQGGPLVI